MAPTEADIKAYELQMADRASRRQARRPAIRAFANLFGLIILGTVIYAMTAAIAGTNLPSNANNDSPVLWTAPSAIIALLVYIGLVAFILSTYQSQGHQIRTIARYRKAQLYPGHPWVQYRIVHPYWSHVVFIGAGLTVLNLLHGRRPR
jgi:hypothetical protein